MPTTKTRVNITVPSEIRDALRKLAKRDRLPASTKAARLLELALELEEDQIWNDIAEKRDKKKARFVPHRRAWEKNRDV